jgi:hypothetical protein
MARANEKRYGHPVGADGGCFEAALKAVLQWGGVLEHPAFSLAYERFGLKKPRGIGWLDAGGYWVCEVWQSAYGHKARKRTWLLWKGPGTPKELNWERPKGTHQCGWQDRRGKARNLPTLGKAEALRTPEAFAQELVGLCGIGEGDSGILGA